MDMPRDDEAPSLGTVWEGVNSETGIRGPVDVR